jgi:hypothetical protein
MAAAPLESPHLKVAGLRNAERNCDGFQFDANFTRTANNNDIE